MATKIDRTLPILDAIDALLAGDIQFDGHIGIGRPPSEVPLHVSQAVVADGTNTCALQVDNIVTGGQGGVHAAIKAQTVAGPGWNSNSGQTFGVTSETENACLGTGEPFGGQWHAKALIGAEPGKTEVAGGEIDVVLEVQGNTRVVAFMGAMPYWQRPTFQGFQATGLDTILAFVTKKYAAPFKAGITFLQSDPTKTVFPIAPNGTLILASPVVPTSVKDGLDFSQLAFSGASIRVPGFTVSGSGLTTITAYGARLTLADTGAGSSWSIRSTVGAFSVRDETLGTDRLRIDHRGNFCMQAKDPGANAEGVMVIPSGVEPTSSPADMIQLFSVDHSPGKATLGLRTEAQVVTESVTPDATLILRINGASYKWCLKKV